MKFIQFIEQYGPQLSDGLRVTLKLSLAAIPLATLIAVSTGLVLGARRIWFRGIASIYVEIFRGTSLLIQLFWIFYVLPLFGLEIDSFVAGVLAISLNVGAYGAELFRGAISAVPKGQQEAAIALNMSTWDRTYRIVLPQAALIALPAYSTLLIELLKGTALVSLISVPELMFQARQINAETLESAKSFGTAMLVYYVLARFGLTPALRALERRWRKRVTGR